MADQQALYEAVYEEHLYGSCNLSGSSMGGRIKCCLSAIMDVEENPAMGCAGIRLGLTSV